MALVLYASITKSFYTPCAGFPTGVHDGQNPSREEVGVVYDAGKGKIRRLVLLLEMSKILLVLPLSPLHSRGAPFLR